MTTLEIRDLSVHVHNQPIVTDISLSLSLGEWLCVIGPNGAGKSTLLKAIAGLARSSGHLHINDH